MNRILVDNSTGSQFHCASCCRGARCDRRIHGVYTGSWAVIDATDTLRDVVAWNRAAAVVLEVGELADHAITFAYTGRSTFPPVRMSPTRFPAIASRSRINAASAAAPAPSARLWVSL